MPWSGGRKTLFYGGDIMNRIRIIIIIFLGLFAFTSKAFETDPFLRFKEKVDLYTVELSKRPFTDKDAMEFWKIADQSVLSVYNDFIQSKRPADFIGERARNDTEHPNELSATNDCNTLTYYSSRPPEFLAHELENQKIKWAYLIVSSCGQGGMSWTYNEILPPDGATQEFSVSITPLTLDNAILYVEYTRSGYGTEQLYFSLPIISTFRIMERNSS